MKKKQFLVNDTVIVVNYEEADFTEALKGYADCDTTYLVRYDSSNNCAIVDQSAPEWYKGLAALHEMICCGHFFEDLVPNINKADQDHRCMCIENSSSTVSQTSGRIRTQSAAKTCSRSY